MNAAATLDTARPQIRTSVRIEMPETPESTTAAVRATMSLCRPLSARPQDVQIFGDGVTTQVATMLRPIATPLNLGGFSPDVAEMLGASFRDYGFMPIAGAAAAAQTAGTKSISNAPLRPGSAVGINSVSGAVNMGATGTVTGVIGNKNYAFGRQVHHWRPSDFPPA